MSKKKNQPIHNVREFEGRFPASVLNSDAVHPDPASGWPGAPPNFGRDIVPHIYTVSGWVGSQARAYPLEDEAMRASPDNAERMRKDPDIKECLLARQRAVALLPWSLVPEDEQDPRQKQLCADLTTILERSKRFTEMRRYLMEAIWYGKSFVQLKYGLGWVGGQQRKIIREWEPRHSDKIVFRYSDGTADYQAGQVGIRVHAGYKHVRPDQIQPTQYGLAYWLRDYERRLCVVHKHEIEDGPYMDPWMSGRIHGVGIRDAVYWTWFASKNVEANLLEYLERTALGIEIWRYPSGNAEAEKKARAAAQERFNNGRSVIMVPVIPGEQADLFGVQHIEPSPAGADLLLTICQQFYAHKIKRLILGQTLSSEAAATGLGSGVADAHLATYADIIRYDAINLQETLTDELVQVCKEENFPWARKVYIRMALSTEDPEVQEKLGALQSAWNMGLKVRAEDLYQLVGARRPDEEDDVLENPGIANGKLQVAMGMQQLQMQAAQAQQMQQAQAAGQVGPDGQPVPADAQQAGPPAQMEVSKEAAAEPGAQAVNPWAGFWDSLFAAARGQGIVAPAGAEQLAGPAPNGNTVSVDQGELSRIFDERFEEATERRQATAQDLYDALVRAVDQQPDASTLRDQLRFLFVWTDAQGQRATPYGDPWGALTNAFAARAIADAVGVHSAVKPANRVNGHGPREALLAALQARFGGTPERYDQDDPVAQDLMAALQPKHYDQEVPTDIIAGTDHYQEPGEPDQYGAMATLKTSHAAQPGLTPSTVAGSGSQGTGHQSNPVAQPTSSGPAKFEAEEDPLTEVDREEEDTAPGQGIRGSSTAGTPVPPKDPQPDASPVVEADRPALGRFVQSPDPETALARYQAGEIGAEELERYALELSAL